MTEGRTFHPEDIVYGLRNLREFLPGQADNLYRFADFLAEVFDTNCGLYPSAFANGAFKEIRYLREGQHPISCGYTAPAELTGLPENVYFDFFDMIPKIFSAITYGNLEKGIIEKFKEIKANGAERLDPVGDAGERFVAARSGVEFHKDSLKPADYSRTTIYEVKKREQLPPYVWSADLQGGFIPREATHFIHNPFSEKQWFHDISLMRPR